MGRDSRYDVVVTDNVDGGALPGGSVVLLTALERRPPALPSGYLTLTKPIKPRALMATLVQAVTGEGRVRDDSAPVPDDKAPVPLRILLAEDNDLNQRLALAMLNRLGHEADVVGDGAQVLVAAARKRYDLILMDLQMPILDGLETTRRLIATLSGPRPRIVALTANATSADRDACLAAGMDDYLAKPIELDTLRQALARCQPLPPARSTTGGSPTSGPSSAIRHSSSSCSRSSGATPRSSSLRSLRRCREAIPTRCPCVVSTLRSNAAQFGAEELAEACRVAEEELITSGYTGQAEAIASALDSVLVAVDEALDGRVKGSGQAATS